MSHKRISGTWHEAMSLPRELSLPRDGVLRIKPLRELEQLRYNPICEKDSVVESGATNRLANVSGDTIEIMATIKQGDAKRYGVRLLCDKDNTNGLDLVVEPGAGTIKLGSTTAPFELKRDASNAGYHYLGCAKTFALMGKAFAEALVSFQKIQGRAQQ